MPPVTTIQPYLPVKESLVAPSTGVLTPVGLQWFQQQAGNIAAMATSINTVPGVNLFTVATQPTLGAGDVGFIGILTDYDRMVFWTGTTWLALGDCARFVDLPVAPTGPGFQLCDGTVTSYLVCGASLTETSFTTPDLISTPAYRKAAAAYTGTIAAKAAPTTTGTGTTGTGTTGTGTTGTGVTGTDVTGIPSAFFAANVIQGWTSGGSVSPPSNAHTHTVPALTIPGLSVPSLSVPGLSVPALSIGAIEMANLGVLPYFRR